MSDAAGEVVRSRISSWLSYCEDAIYFVTGAGLVVTAIAILVSAAGTFVSALRAGALVQDSVAILDSMLLVLMIVEILHTIRVSVLKHSLLAEPFLIVALIAGVRRVLILTVEAARFLPSQPEQFQRVLQEMALLAVFFVVLVGSMVLLRRFPPTGVDLR